MSPEASAVLINEVIPILTSIIPRLRIVGSDDAEEMLQDGIASASAMLDSADRAGKPLLGRSTAHYCLQRVKVGRKSTSASRTDAMSVAAALDGNAVCFPMDQATSGTGEDGEQLTLSEMLMCSTDDPAVQVGRALDWESCIADLDACDKNIIVHTAEGRSGNGLAERWHLTPARITQKKRAIAGKLMERSGGNILRDSQSKPLWASNIMAVRERALCRQLYYHDASDGVITV